eukprot:1743608-Rhodomonas_salina.2
MCIRDRSCGHDGQHWRNQGNSGRASQGVAFLAVAARATLACAQGKLEQGPALELLGPTGLG